MKPRIVLSLHRWIALVVAPLLAMQAVTGGILLFRDDLAGFGTSLGHDAGEHIAPLSVIAGRARTDFPEYRLSRLFLPRDARHPVFAQFESPGGGVRHAQIDPVTAQVVSTGSIWRYPLEAALQLHFRLAAGNIGLVVVSLYGLALVVISLTGLWHFWPGRRRLVQALKVPARTPQRLRLRMWHRSAGAVLALVLLVTATTGILTAWPSLSFAAPAPAPPPFTWDAQATDTAFARAATAFPGATARDVRFLPDGSLAINYRAPRAHVIAVDTVSISTLDPAVMTATAWEDNAALWALSLPIHSGAVAGIVGRILMLAAAGGLLFLSISGPLAWWRARRKVSRQ